MKFGYSISQEWCTYNRMLIYILWQAFVFQEDEKSLSLNQYHTTKLYGRVDV